MRHHPLQAALAMVGSMAIIGVIDTYIAVIASDISLWQFQVLRASIALPILVLLAGLGFVRIRPKRLWAVLLRNGSIAVGMLFYFGALAFMPIAQALAGLFVAPIFVLLISVGFFGERVGLLRIAAILTGFAGVLLVLQPKADTLVLSLMPAIGGFFYALGSVMTQRLCAEETTPSMLVGLFSLQALIGLFAVLALWIIAPIAPEGAEGFLLRGWGSPEPRTWIIIALQAVGSLIGVGLLIHAYQSAQPSFVAVFEYSVFIFGPLYAFWVFGQSVSALQLFGIALIAASGAVIALRGRE